MPRKPMNVGNSLYSSSEGARHRSSGSNATRYTVKAVAKREAEAAKRAATEAKRAATEAAKEAKRAATEAAKAERRCHALKCDEPGHIADDPNGPVRYSLAQCKRACEEGSTLCGPCTKVYDVPGKWHAKIGNTQLHPTSHARDPRFPMSEWNRATIAKSQARTAKATKSQAPKTQGRRGPAYTLKNKSSSEHRSNAPLTLRQRTSSNTRRARLGRGRGGLTQVKSQKRGYSWF